MASYPYAFVRRNPLSPSLMLIMGGVLLGELYVIGLSESLFNYLFVAQAALTPGLLLAPLAHAAIVVHFSVNIVLFLLCGWPMETQVDPREFLSFTVVAAYVPTYLQVTYSMVTVGHAATLGFSGAVYAYPPAYAFLAFRSGDYDDRFGVLSVATVLSFVIPFSIAGYVDLVSGGLPSARITHIGGYTIGVAYGSWKYWRR